MQLDREDFEQLVGKALDELPDEFAEQVDNVAVVVADEPDPADLRELGLDAVEDADELFGLYVGTPLIDRETSYSGLPDRIYIYMGPILRACATPAEVVREVRDTVVHELGHHFGLSDDEMPY
ncbi:MAG TPA: metallopeptidase family protein [Gemmatimonadota bacterium]|nr:metallopeptidase family protein [Gemmatimonadota bacterium]